MAKSLTVSGSASEAVWRVVRKQAQLDPSPVLKTLARDDEVAFPLDRDPPVAAPLLLSISSNELAGDPESAAHAGIAGAWPGPTTRPLWTSSESATTLPVDFWTFVRMQNSRVARRSVEGPAGRPPLISPPASRPYEAQPGSARSSVTRQHRLLARSLLPVGLNRSRWETSSRWLPQWVKSRSALILLAHHGAVRRRDAIVRAGGWGSATASAAPRSGPAGSTFGGAGSRSARHAQNSAWSRPG